MSGTLVNFHLFQFSDLFHFNTSRIAAVLNALANEERDKKGVGN